MITNSELRKSVRTLCKTLLSLYFGCYFNIFSLLILTQALFCSFYGLLFSKSNPFHLFTTEFMFFHKHCQMLLCFSKWKNAHFQGGHVYLNLTKPRFRINTLDLFLKRLLSTTTQLRSSQLFLTHVNQLLPAHIIVLVAFQVKVLGNPMSKNVS